MVKRSRGKIKSEEQRKRPVAMATGVGLIGPRSRSLDQGQGQLMHPCLQVRISTVAMATVQDGVVEES